MRGPPIEGITTLCIIAYIRAKTHVDRSVLICLLQDSDCYGMQRIINVVILLFFSLCKENGDKQDSTLLRVPEPKAQSSSFCMQNDKDFINDIDDVQVLGTRISSRRVAPQVLSPLHRFTTKFEMDWSGSSAASAPRNCYVLFLSTTS